MTDATTRYTWLRYSPPLDAELIDELTRLWEQVFECSFSGLKPVLEGSEVEDNNDVVYVARDGDRVAGTCHLTVCKSDPRVGGVGEVAVPPEYRRQGLATKLCQQALDEFRSVGGEALFLGTVNPEAARVYERLGWRRLNGSTVMLWNKQQMLPDEFLRDWFREQNGPRNVPPALATIRIPLIPLAVADHPWLILDINTELYSTRHVTQNSCMGLYPRYEQAAKRGAIFRAWTPDDMFVGAVTVRFDGEHSARIDGFTHADYRGYWDGLIESAVRFARDERGLKCYAVVAAADEEKRRAFEITAFRDVGSAGTILLNGCTVAMRRLELTD